MDFEKFKEDMKQKASGLMPLSADPDPIIRELNNARRNEKLALVEFICDIIEEYDKIKQE